MDPYSSFRYEHDFYIHGSNYHFFKYQYPGSNLADYTSVYRGFRGHFSHVAERLHFTGILLAPYSRCGLFGIAFAIVSARAFWEMYSVRKNYAQN